MTLVLDDFTQGADATEWTAFTDQVMGGVSTGGASLMTVSGRRALVLRGHVSLERNGGFVQMARTLGANEKSMLDARAYSGVNVSVCGSPGTYFVHLRTTDTKAPWQYYGAELPVTQDWAEVTIRWEQFKAMSLRAPLDVTRLMRLGVVAAQTAFDAQVAVSRLALVP
jgi:hypothetical protein